MNRPYFLLDMDGVLYAGDQPLPGAVEFVRALPAQQFMFITNNSSLPETEIALKLTQLGFQGIVDSHILTSATATAQWLDHRQPGFRYYAVGGQGLHQALARKGTEDAWKADYVVVGEGPGLDYQSLSQGINLILSGNAELIATNPDATVDGRRNGQPWLLPGGGALVAPFEAATGQAATVIGKPHPLLYQMALRQLGAEVRHCIMIGDRPDTDIAGAAALGMRTALVHSGRYRPEQKWPESVPRPTWTVSNLMELYNGFKQLGLL